MDKQVIAICLAKIQWDQQKDIVDSICRAAADEGMVVQIFNMFDDMFNGYISERGEKAIMRLIDYKKLSALVILSETIKKRQIVDELIANANKAGVPVISIDQEHDDCYNILFDYENVFEELVRHVVEFHGCTRVNFIAGMKNNVFSQTRVNAYTRVLSENDIPIEEDRIGYGDFWEWPARKVTEKFINSSLPFPQAIICANDVMAISAMEVLYEYGYTVPDDVIVVGFDGTKIGRYYSPTLTTAIYDKESVGHRVVYMIEKIKDGTNSKKEVYIPYKKLLAQSCGCEPMDNITMNRAAIETYKKYDGIRNHVDYMYTMIREMSHIGSVKEIETKLHKYIYEMEFVRMQICVSKEFLQYDHAVLDDDIDMEDMVVWIDISSNQYYRNPMEEFKFSLQLPDDDYLKSRNPSIFVPLHANDIFFGYLAVEYELGKLDYQRLYEFTMVFNLVTEQLREKDDFKIKSNIKIV